MRLFRIEFLFNGDEGFVETKEFPSEEKAIGWACDYAEGLVPDEEYSHFEVYDLFEEVTLGTFKDPERNAWFADLYANGKFIPQIVAAAANRSACKTLYLVGARHWDYVMQAQADALPVGRYEFPISEQGFIDQYGNFLTRMEAAKIVQRNNQALRAPVEGKHLYSENLY